MRVLVVGGGGREHALAWRLSLDPCVTEVFVAPGNAGTDSGKVSSVPANDIGQWVAAAGDLRADLTVVGPERPLADGIVDAFAERGLVALGPCAEAARIESSKSYAKDLMAELGIPTANNSSAESLDEAKRFIERSRAPFVVKADGLARGKATAFAEDGKEALEIVADCLSGRYGDASRKVVIEEMIAGEEVSLTALCDGDGYVLLPGSLDYKRLEEGGTGPNTGGMGAVSPSPAEASGLVDLHDAAETVVRPVLEAMKSRGTPYRGFLYAGLMVSEDGIPFVLEYNCRLGDPEAQAILPRVTGELAPALAAAASGRLSDPCGIGHADGHCAAVVLASEGYPDDPRLGQEVRLPADVPDGRFVFHAGTERSEGGTVAVSGGRVACSAAIGADLRAARKDAYELAGQVAFEGRVMRGDIGGTDA